MDKVSRDNLQDATQEIRQILEAEFIEQLEGSFDIMRDGTVAAEPGPHLNAQQRLTRRKIVAAITHSKAGGKKASEAVVEYIRESAFTFLNRFVALRMLEAHGILQECVSNGDESSGFKEFSGLASGLSALTDGGYRLYLESLFDELSVEVKILFDRRDTASLLWPGRTALMSLCEVFRRPALSNCWSDSEAIGWMYQYFNSSDERRSLRDRSPTPRNGQELAIRNQFFTPRYVVEFLTDNTLGRIWFEMCHGKSNISNECRFLTQPTLIEGSANESMQISRDLKDPRDIKVLDPACGSGHFLLYAFDLLLSIYEEGWRFEDGPVSIATGSRLRDDYQSIDDLRKELPALIVRHNLHGIDIDARASQIAAFAIWIRAQRAYNEFEVKREDRLPIKRSNIVCAEPMPGESELVTRYVEQLEQTGPEGKLVAQIVVRVFDAMKIAGEAGSLLKIEEEISSLVAEAKRLWTKRRTEVQQHLFERDEAKHRQMDLEFAVREISDAGIWEQLEEKLYASLADFCDSASTDKLERRLFADDAASGLGFVNLSTLKYDAILTNPPFGECTARCRSYLSSAYPSAKDDLGMTFITRLCELLSSHGRIGAITTRTFLANDSLETWRRDCLLGGHATMREFLDLGYGVLQGAKVEVAAYVVEKGDFANEPIIFHTVLDEQNKEDAAISLICRQQPTRRAFAIPREIAVFKTLPSATIAYHIPVSLIKQTLSGDVLEHRGARAYQGLIPADDFRYLRLAWEVPADNVGTRRTWCLYAKGGEYSPFWDDIHLVVNWAKDGREIRNFFSPTGKLRSRPQNISRFFRPGLTYPSRTTSDLSPRVLPADCIFSAKGQAILFDDLSDALLYLGGAFSRKFKLLVDAFVGGGDCSSPSTMATDYRAGLLTQLPPPSHENSDELSNLVREAIGIAFVPFTYDETSRTFNRSLLTKDTKSFHELATEQFCVRLEHATRMLEIHQQIERSVHANLDAAEQSLVESTFGPHPLSYERKEIDRHQLLDLYKQSDSDLISAAVEKCGARRQLTRKSYFANRRLELLSHILEAHPESIVRILREDPDAFVFEDLRDILSGALSYAIGCAVGRWDVRRSSQQPDVDLADFFSALPARPPGMLNSDNLDDYPLAIGDILVDDEGHQHDILANVEKVFVWISPGFADNLTSEVEGGLSKGRRSLRQWMQKDFFDEHCKQYSKSRRKAPIYWQLATPSASYSVWLYYHRFTKDTFFKVLNEYVKPKLDHERQKLDRLRSEAGTEPTRSQRKEIEDQERFVAELASMVEEVERIAPLWNPNLNDGVIINFAPLWRLVPQNKSWQKECKKVWDKLVGGDYDWAHLAMHLWPDRVVPKCVTDASLAIAHGLEETFWTQDDRDRFQPLEEPEGGWQPIIDQLVVERSSPAVKAASESLLDAPAPTTTKTKRKRKAAAK